MVARNATVETKFPGGLAAYERECPNGTFCSDGKICRVAFMVEADAREFAAWLERSGLSGPAAGEASDIALVDGHVNCLEPCDWLEVDLRTFADAYGRQQGVTLAWLRGDNAATFTAPAWWKPGEVEPIPRADLPDNYELVDVTRYEGGGSIAAYRHRATGKMFYLPRPKIAGTTTVHERYKALIAELRSVEEQPPLPARQEAFAAIAERAAQLVHDTRGQEPGPLLLQGIAARYLKRWELAAESARAVTVLRPDLMDGWLGLTWALASLGQLDAAQSCARRAVALDATSPAALGNLATVLFEQEKLEEAFVTISSALQIDPEDSMNQALFERIGVAREQSRSEARVPWYRKLWRQ